jgi:hypothetical protein
MHKTGSTSIQQSLAKFSDEKFLYGRFGELGNHSLTIYTLFSSNPERHHLHRNAPDRVAAYKVAAFEKLERSIAAARGRTLLLSGEDISALPEGDLTKLRDYLAKRFDDLTIVGYVRPPGGFIGSSFQQRVQGGGMNVFDPQRLYQSYRTRFEKFDRVFGRDRVQLWKFDPKTFPQGDVVLDFARKISLTPPRRIIRTNESLPAQGVAALYGYNKFGEYAGANILEGNEGAALARLFTGEKFRLSPAAIRPVLAANQADIMWMEERLGQSLDESLGEHQDNDVRTEHDLLRPNPALAATLRKKLGNAVPPDANGATPQDIARLIHMLRTRRRYLDPIWWFNRIRGDKELTPPAAKTTPPAR